MENVDSIFANRYGGSVNIRGISYQIRYSILKAFELLNGNANSITLEGIEDLDLNGILLNDDNYFQIKTSDRPWQWNKTIDPVLNFIEVFKLSPNSNFILVLSNILKGDVEKLSNYNSLSNKEKIDIQNKFIKLCHKKVNYPDKLLIEFLDKLSIISLSDESLDSYLRHNLTNIFNINTDATDIYLAILISYFFEWAKQRRTIEKSDFINLITEAKEKLIIEKSFNAVGEGLISKINWDTNNYTNDYYEGKNTHPSHITSNADFKRTKWLEVIEKAVRVNKTCIIKGASGQGKSSLLYRYANDFWLKENIYKINALNKIEHSELLLQFLKHRAKLNLPILVLIDNLNYNFNYWSNLIKECTNLDIHFLISVRNDDWFKYGKEGLEFEVIEPYLDLDEAIEIYQIFKRNGKVSNSVTSPEVAYEQIGESKLLIEYIYLITQGEMLSSRLKDQINQIYLTSDYPPKIDLLRKVILSNIFEAPLKIDDLIKSSNFNTTDPQIILQSLDGEFLKIENDLLFGMHWVRNKHLYEILFDKYINTSTLALDIINSIPEDFLISFISNILSDKSASTEILINGILKKKNEFEISKIIAIIEGIYIAGERNFYLKNKIVFDEANLILGHNGPGFIADAFLVATDPVDTIDRMLEILDDEKGINFLKLKELKERIINTERGVDICKNFIDDLLTDLEITNFSSTKLIYISKLLDWICFCKIEKSITSKLAEVIFKYLEIFNTIPLDDLIISVQSFYKYNQDLYMEWFNERKEDIVSFLKLETDSIFIKIENNLLSLKFIPSGTNVHKQTIERIKLLQAILPFIINISSEGLYYFPEELKPSHDESIKNIENKIEHFKLDVDKNKLLLEVILENYNISSYYKYQEYLFKLRIDILNFFKEFKSILIKLFKNIPHKAKNNFEDGLVIERILVSIKIFPNLPSQTNNEVKEKLQTIIGNWSVQLKYFILHIDNYVSDNTQTKYRDLAIVNLRNAMESLPDLHLELDKLFTISPDYFNQKDLRNEELRIYSEMYDLIDLKYKINPSGIIKNPLEYIQNKRNKENNYIIENIKNNFVYYTDKYIFSEVIYQKEGLNYYSIMFRVEEENNVLKDMEDLLLKLYPIDNGVNYYCLIPIKNEKRITEGCYFISKNTINALMNNGNVGWEAFFPIDTKNELIKGLPNYDYDTKINIKFENFISAIIFNLKCSENYKNIILKFLDNNNIQEKLLIEKHKSKIQEIFTDVFRIINDKIKREFNEIKFEYLNIFTLMEKERETKDVFEINFNYWITQLELLK